MTERTYLEHIKTDPTTGVNDAGVYGIGASLPWLKNHLRSLGVRIHDQATLARAFSALERLSGYVQSDATVRFSSAAEAQKDYFRGCGADFLSKALQRGHLAGLRGFDKHYSDLAKANPVVTGPDGNSSLARNRAWELLLASLTATIATDVAADEPDVTCSFAGRRIGLAAKVLYSADTDKQLRRIQEGAKQLEESDVEEGFVVANAVELFPHEKMFELLRGARVEHNDDVVNIVDVWTHAFMAAHNIDDWARRLRGSSKLLSVLFFLPTVLYMGGLSNPQLPYFGVHYVSVGDRDSRARDFIWRLNATCQDVLLFRPPVPVCAESV